MTDQQIARTVANVTRFPFIFFSPFTSNHIFCPISARLSFSNRSADSEVLNVESASHNELSLEI